MRPGKSIERWFSGPTITSSLKPPSRIRHASALTDKSIAVLAFEDLSADGDQEYFADGMTEALITDLAKFGAPVILFSGGEPLVRRDLPELAAFAVEKGMRAVISTNGTLITSTMAHTLKKIGLSYVGISLDGMEEINDRFRGVKGAFKSALSGIENCQEAGIKVGLRFTINKFNKLLEPIVI